MIVKEGSKYVVKSKDGKKRLGVFATLEAAKKRLGQIEYFKGIHDFIKKPKS